MARHRLQSLRLLLKLRFWAKHERYERGECSAPDAAWYVSRIERIDSLLGGAR